MLPDTPKSALPVYQPLVGVLVIASAGILADRFLVVPVWIWLLLAAVALVRWRVLHGRAVDRPAAITLLVSVFCLGGAWHHRWWNLFAADDVGRFATREAQPVVIEGIAQSGVRRVPAPPHNPLSALESGDRTRLSLRVTRLRNGLLWQPASGYATVLVDGHLFDVLAGDRVRIYGLLMAPSPALNPGEFDYEEFCRGNRELALVRTSSPQAVEVLGRGTPLNPRRWIDAVRTAGEQTLWRFISSENAGLAAAMFLGLRDELEPEQMDAFKETGTVHLLVVSGLNVGILAGCVLMALKTGWLSNRSAMIVLCLVTILYALVTDAQPPVVRATVLVLAFCFARILGRSRMAYNTLAAAALVVLAINPMELFRPGTQLSFLAVGALIAVGHSWATRPMSNLNALVVESLPSRMQLLYVVGWTFGQSVLVGFVVWCAVQPLVAARFNLITPSAILLGPLVSIPIGVAMASGFAVMTLGVLVPPLGAVAGFICDRSLWIVVSMVEATRDAPGGKFWTTGPADWWLAGFYLVLISWAVVPAVRRIERRWLLATAGVWFTAGLVAPHLARWNDNTLRVAFLSVGHGLAVVVETPDDQCLVYDAGSIASPEMATRAVSAYLHSRHRQRIDLLVISHADADHYNGVPKLLERFPVNQVCYTQRMFRDDTPPLAILRDSLAHAGLKVREVAAGDVLLQSGGVEAKVLFPTASGIEGSDNAASIVLEISFGNHTVLLTGDLESPGLEQVLAVPIAPVDVLLAPHHGSPRSAPAALAEWARPRMVTISGSLRDHQPHVTDAYAADGAQVFHTATHGAVIVEFTDGDPQVKTFLP